MDIVGLTGISKRVVDELMENGVRTIELRSSHNIASAAKLKLGDLVFVTQRSREDLMPGTEGVIARVVASEFGIRRVGVYSRSEVEEKEAEIARLKLEAVTSCRAPRVKSHGVGRETVFYFTENIIECW